MPLLLVSQSLRGLSEWLDGHAAGPRVAVVTSASRALADRDGIIEPAVQEIRRGGRDPMLVDLLAQPPAALAGDAVVMTGGDPFLLLDAVRRSGADRWLQDAHARGAPIAGQSAGAMVCGPSLAAITLTSPFAAPPGLDLTALGLTDHVVLPHHDAPGRAERHHRAARQFGRALNLTPLADDEALTIGPSGWSLNHGRHRTRAATAADAAAVARVFKAAALAAWSTFLGRSRLARAPLDQAAWRARIRAARGCFLVTEDDDGVLGFVQWRPAAAPDDGDSVGEIDLLYTHPRAWGTGCGRRLMARALWALTCEGRNEAVLWTEHRNERALAVYRTAGWRLDGAWRERDYRGVTIRELRHRLAL